MPDQPAFATIDSLEALEALYGTPVAAATRKVADHVTPEYGAWIERSRFAVLVTVGPEGTDGSPRGDDGPVVRILDAGHLALPDWRGNDRIDSLRNIVRDGRVSLMFMIPGSTNVVRVNGRAVLSADPALLDGFARGGKTPRTVAVIRVAEIYFQCARALMRSRLWTAGDESGGLPTAGQMLAAMTAGEVGGADYDRSWPERARATLW
ncbi:pyridoxamine 5'-phosphate oxidase family protein [Frigidibacter sp. MR17.24]|uniref:pyridoxamine 5'-phosphate oxidase family protein n=1 Tax=Frigidibacter sp. MR17.24 TaxID=3127345 RepID=UPI003012FEE6